MAGVAGAVLTQTTETVSLGVLDFQRSADILVILILGGAGRLYGGLVGAIIYMVARDRFSGVNPQYWYFPIGVLLIAVVLFLPNGILGGSRSSSTPSAASAGSAGSTPWRARVVSAGSRHARPRQELRLARCRATTSRSRCRAACATR